MPGTECLPGLPPSNPQDTTQHGCSLLPPHREAKWLGQGHRAVNRRATMKREGKLNG